MERCALAAAGEPRTANYLTVRASQLALELVEQAALGVEEIAHLLADLFEGQPDVRAIARGVRMLAHGLFEAAGCAVLGFCLGQQVGGYGLMQSRIH